MVFNIITFSLFWLVYRYNTLYVTKFRFDTGGLLYPTAINQLFTGLYLMELCLIGLFFLVKDAKSDGTAYGTPCKAQGIIMIVVLILTFLYQWLLNGAFGSLLRYLPITLEDEAVMRDEEFARAQEKRWKLDENEQEGDDINDVLKDRERLSVHENRAAESIEMQNIEAPSERGIGSKKRGPPSTRSCGKSYSTQGIVLGGPFPEEDALFSGPEGTRCLTPATSLPAPSPT